MRVLLCDDHPLFRDGLRLLLEELGHDVVRDVGSGEEAVRAADELDPDVVVMDLGLPGMSGIEATRRIVAATGCRVLVLSMQGDDPVVIGALRAGASGYVLKGAGREQLAAVLDAVARGDLVLPAPLGDRVRAALTPPIGVPGITGRDAEVLGLVAAGRTNGQIAAALFLAEKTVRNRVSALAARFGAGSRAELVAIARDLGVSRP